MCPYICKQTKQNPQLQLATMLGKTKAAKLVTELWTLLVDAQKSERGIPTEFIEKKKQELLEREKQKVAVTAAVVCRQHLSSHHVVCPFVTQQL